MNKILTFGQKMMIYVGLPLVCNELMKGVLSIIQYRINHEKYSNYHASVRFPWLQHLCWKHRRMTKHQFNKMKIQQLMENKFIAFYFAGKNDLLN